MQNIKVTKLSLWVMVISQLFICLSAKQDLGTAGRKDDIDYQAFYVGTETLETKRLILRQITLDDAEDMFKFTSNSEVETWDPTDKTVEDTRNFIESLQKKYAAKEPALWGIVDKKNNQLIGYCGFTYLQPEESIVDLEYAIDKPYWNKGLMPEALEAVLSFTFNILKINRIIAFTVLHNERSQRVLKKMGFKFEGLHREAGHTHGAFWDMKSYALVRHDYLAPHGISIL
jgi:ribosomal-protein-alanine N-acetyltransferase